MSDFFWFGGGGNWSDFTNHWSDNSGNSPASPKANAPTSSDDVFIDSNSGFGEGGTITLDAEANCYNFTSNSSHNYIITEPENSLTIYSSGIFESGLTFNLAGPRFLVTSTGKTITTNGCDLFTVEFLGVGGGCILQDDLVITGTFYQQNGTFDANDHNVTANNFYFYADTGYTPTVIMGSGTWEATGGGGWLVENYSGEYVEIIPETSTVKLSNSIATDFQTYDDEGINPATTYSNVWYSGNNHIGIWGNNIFNDFKVDTGINNEIIFEAGRTTVVTTFTVSGEDSNLITIDSEDGLTQHTLSCASGTIVCDYLDLSNSNATGGADWYAGSHSADTDNNDGWIFEDAPSSVVKDVISSGIIAFPR